MSLAGLDFVMFFADLTGDGSADAIVISDRQGRRPPEYRQRLRPEPGLDP
jgi:hypothetical protein